MSKSFSSLIFLLVIFLSSLLRSAGNKGKKSGTQAGAQTSGRPGTPAQASRTAPSPTPISPAAPAKASQAASAIASRRAAKTEDCEYGEVNHLYSHSSDRRVAQLNGYLKAGLIDRKEYGEMLERYRRMDREAGTD